MLAHFFTAEDILYFVAVMLLYFFYVNDRHVHNSNNTSELLLSA